MKLINTIINDKLEYLLFINTVIRKLVYKLKLNYYK